MTVEWVGEHGLEGTATSPSPTPPDARRGRIVAFALVGAAAVAAAGFGIGRATAPDRTAAGAVHSGSEVRLSGTVTLRSAYDGQPDNPTSDLCTGNDDFGDVLGGAPVRVLDDQQRLLATTTLTDGSVGSAGCLFTFGITVPNVATSYSVQVAGHRAVALAPSTLGNIQLILD